MEYKTVQSKVNASEGDDERTVTGISAVFGNVDNGGDRIFKGAFAKTILEHSQRIKHLWQHDFMLPPIASILDLKEIGRTDLPKDLKDEYPEAKGGLLVKRRYLDTPRGNEVLAALKATPPAISEMSFGYDPVKFDFEEVEEGDMKGNLIRNLREVRLWDTSDVIWGMNKATVAQIKSVVPFRDTGKADESKEWSSPSLVNFGSEDFDLEDEEKTRVFAHYAYSSNVPPQSFDDLRFPHHLPSKHDVGPAVFSGVVASMNELMKSDPGVPEKDRVEVYEHLARHYEQFGKSAPDLKVLKLTWVIGDSVKILRDDGFARDGFDKDFAIRQLVDMDRILRAEPKQFDPALLTQASVFRELAIRQRKLVFENI